MPISPIVSVSGALVLSVGAFAVASHPALFVPTGVGALAAWGVALNGAMRRLDAS